MIKAVLILVAIAAIFSYIIWKWVEGIDSMQNDYPDYKGEDFFDED